MIGLVLNEGVKNGMDNWSMITINYTIFFLSSWLQILCWTVGVSVKNGNRNDRIGNGNDRNRKWLPNFLHKIAKNLNLCGKVSVPDLVVSVSVLYRDPNLPELQSHVYFITYSGQLFPKLKPYFPFRQNWWYTEIHIKNKLKNKLAVSDAFIFDQQLAISNIFCSFDQIIVVNVIYSYCKNLPTVACFVQGERISN